MAQPNQEDVTSAQGDDRNETAHKASSLGDGSNEATKNASSLGDGCNEFAKNASALGDRGNKATKNASALGGGSSEVIAMMPFKGDHHDGATASIFNLHSTTFSLMTFNCGRGIKDSTNKQADASKLALDTILFQNCPDILFLQEVTNHGRCTCKRKRKVTPCTSMGCFMDKNGYEYTMKENGKVYTYVAVKNCKKLNVTFSDKEFGVSLFDTIETRTQFRAITGRFSFAKIQMENTKQSILLASWHGPHNEMRDPRVRQTNLRDSMLFLKEMMREIRASQLILGGDFNLRSDLAQDILDEIMYDTECPPLRRKVIDYFITIGVTLLGTCYGNLAGTGTKKNRYKVLDHRPVIAYFNPEMEDELTNGVRNNTGATEGQQRSPDVNERQTRSKTGATAVFKLPTDGLSFIEIRKKQLELYEIVMNRFIKPSKERKLSELLSKLTNSWNIFQNYWQTFKGSDCVYKRNWRLTAQQFHWDFAQLLMKMKLMRSKYVQSQNGETPISEKHNHKITPTSSRQIARQLFPVEDHEAGMKNEKSGPSCKKEEHRKEGTPLEICMCSKRSKCKTSRCQCKQSSRSCSDNCPCKKELCENGNNAATESSEICTCSKKSKCKTSRCKCKQSSRSCSDNCHCKKKICENGRIQKVEPVVKN